MTVNWYRVACCSTWFAGPTIWVAVIVGLVR